MKKTALITFSIIVIALVGGVVYIKTNLNSIVKSAIEKYGSEVTQTDVKVEKVDIVLESGKGTVSGFSIGNPKSFFAASAIRVGSVMLEVDRSTITGSGPIVINEIDVESPQVIYEVNATGNNNLQTLQQNVSSGSAEKSSESGSGEPSRKVIIKNLYIKDGEVGITHALLARKKVKATLPSIHLTNIGESGAGATPEQVAAVVFSAITKTASQSGQQALLKELPNLKSLSGDAAKNAKEAVKGSLGKFLGK